MNALAPSPVSDAVASAVDEAIEQDLPEARWSGPLQAFHRHEMMEKRLREVRFLHIIGFVLGAACLVLDSTVGLLAEGAMLRLGLGGVVFGLAIFLPRSKTLWVETLRAIAPVILTALIVSILAEMAPADEADRYIMGGAFFVAMAIIMLPLRMKEHVLLATLGFAGLVGAALVAKGFSAVPYPDIVAFLVLCCAGPLAIAHRTTRLRDQNFLLALQARLSQEQLLESNASLRQLSDEDPLTGLLNRRGFSERFDQAYASALDSGETLAVFMIDIDHFKSFNDTHGHPAGDKCLKKVAQGLAEQVEGEDALVARFGGEEFIAAWRGASLDEAASMAERLRMAVSDMRVGENGRILPGVTASVGWSAVSGKRAKLSQMVKRADKALYRAKQAGRNRSIVFVRQVLPGVASG